MNMFIIKVSKIEGRESIMRKTAVITGSAQGLGFEMAKQFRSHGFNVVLSDVNEEKLADAASELNKLNGPYNGVAFTPCNVTDMEELENLWQTAVDAFGSVNVWVNNAGVNQPMVPLWQLEKKQMDILVDIDLKGAMYGCRTAISHMAKQGFGCVYCIEGFGADNATQLGLTAYGAAKKGVQYMVRGLAKELTLTNTSVQVGRLNPGIMITNFIAHPLGGKGEMELSDKVKKVYNILGDYPDTVAKFLVQGMVENTEKKKQDDYIAWLTTGKAAWRFMTSAFNKRNFFADEKQETSE
jgi:NAD(P)-dependent dehydrogenase (short-subunit alcohol dehydrogenase family)